MPFAPKISKDLKTHYQSRSLRNHEKFVVNSLNFIKYLLGYISMKAVNVGPSEQRHCRLLVPGNTQKILMEI